MNFLKNIKSLESEISALPKYYNSHVWITAPAADGFSYVGISEFAKRYFVRFNRLNMDGFAKTLYGMANRAYIEAFIRETRERKQRDELSIAEKIQWERFHVKKNEPFVMLETIQFNIQLMAPVDLRVVDYELDTYLFYKILSVPYFFQVEALQPLQLTSLMSEEEYNRSRKMFML